MERPARLERLLVHRPWVRALARRLVRDESRADDLVQQTWLAAIENPPRDDAAPRAWLGTVLRNWARRGHRTDERRERRESASPPGTPEPSPEELIAEADAHQRLVKHVVALAEPYRTTVLLRYFEDLPPREIAQRMGVPVNTVRTRLQRAAGKLRTEMDDEHGGERARWALALIPELRLPPAPVASGAATGAAGGAGASAALVGVTLMSTKLKVAAAAAVVLLLGVGFWSATAPDDPVADVARAGAHEAPSGATDVATPETPRERADEAPTRHDPAPTSGPRDTIEVRTIGGVPVEGATVEIHDDWPAQNTLPLGSLMASVAHELAPVDTATTGADGTVSIPALDRARRWRMIARAPGLVSDQRVFGPRGGGGDTEIFALRMHPTGELSGRVVDCAGDAVAGAVVAVGSRTAGWVAGMANDIRTRSATTGPDGRFRVAGLALDDVFVAYGRADGPLIPYGSLRVPQAGAVEFVLPDGISATGRVLDAGTREPLADALVAVQVIGGGSGTGTATRTDAQGRYAFHALPPKGELAFHVRHPGYADLQDLTPDERTKLVEGKDVERDLLLGPGHTLEGVVRGPDGPVPAARLTVMGKRSWTTTRTTAFTDADGRYAVAGLAPGEVAVVVSVDGYLQEDVPPLYSSAVSGGTFPARYMATIEEPRTTLDIELTRGSTVAGQVVTPDGAGAAGARVWAMYTQGAEAYGTYNFQSAVTGPDGSFRFTGLGSAAPVRLSASRKGWRGSSVLVEDLAEKGEVTGVRVELVPLRTLTGRLIVPDGDPAHEVWIEVFARDGVAADVPFDRAGRQHGGQVYVGADGRFETTLSIASGSIAIRARVPGRMAPEPTVVEVREGADPVEVDVRLAPAFTRRLRVVADDSGIAIAGAVVERVIAGENTRNYRRPDEHRVLGHTDQDGRVTLEGVAEGSLRLRARAAGFQAAELIAATPASEETTLRLPRDAFLAGSVKLPDGTPVVGAKVVITGQHLRSETGGMFGNRSQVTDERGGFRFDELPAVDLALRVTPQPGGTSIVAVTRSGVRPQPDLLEIVAPAAYAISGVVRDEDGEPVAKAWVHVTPEGEDANGYAATADEHGRFEAVGIPAGTYVLSSRGEAYGTPQFCWTDRAGVRAGARDIVLELARGLALAGTIVDAEGAPLQGARVRAVPRAVTRTRGREVPIPQADAQTDAAGRFRIGGLLDGRYDLIARMPSDSVPTLVLEGGRNVRAGSTELRLTARPGGTVRGRVTMSGRPWVVSVVLRNERGEPVQQTRSGSDGFAFGGLDPDVQYLVDATISNLICKPVRVRAGDEDVEVVLEPGGGVQLRLVDADGVPVAGARIRFRPLFGSGVKNAFATTNAQGKTSAYVSEGSYAVDARVEGSAEYVEVGRVETGGEEVELRSQ